MKRTHAQPQVSRRFIGNYALVFLRYRRRRRRPNERLGHARRRFARLRSRGVCADCGLRRRLRGPSQSGGNHRVRDRQAIRRRRALPYIAAQCLGAIAASATLKALFVEPGNLGATLPSGTNLQSWVYEFLLTRGLMYVVLSVSSGAKEKGITAGLAIGAVVGPRGVVRRPGVRRFDETRPFAGAARSWRTTSARSGST